MSINYYGDTKTFVLENSRFTYAMGIDDDGVLVNIYFGKRISDGKNLKIKHRTIKNWIGSSACNYEYMPECPGRGGLTFEESVVDAEFSDGVRDTRLIYKSHAVSSDADADILTVTLTDSHYPLEADLVYRLYRKTPLLGKSIVFRNVGDEKIKLHAAKSGVVYLPYGKDYELLAMHGNWAKEYRRETVSVPHGKTVLESLRGSSSGPHHVPFFALHEKGKCGETFGEVWYGVVEWSGNFKICVEKNQAEMTSVTAGIGDKYTVIHIDGGESFETPNLTVSYSSSGLENITVDMYDYQFDVLCPRSKVYNTLPIIYNSWYPYEFDVDREKLLGLIEKSRRVGAELFVIDDGWMANRPGGISGLGDWDTDAVKFPNGIREISDAAHRAGMLFGLWFEPEMVTKDSRLFAEHPDWVLSYPTRKMTPMRRQYILNLANSKVAEYIWQVADRLISENSLDYLKWDMNRYISEPGYVGGSEKEQDEVYVNYTKNLFGIWDKINRKYPHVLLECCAHGGARTDFGMLRWSDRINRSDNSDPVDVVKLHEGYSFLFLPKMAGGAGNIALSPHRLNGRVTPLGYRADLGMTGSMSIGINLLLSDEKELAEIAQRTAAFKKIRSTVQNSYVYRIFSVEEHPYAVWQYMGRDGKEAVIFAFGNGLNAWERIPYARLRGLDENALYEVDGRGKVSGSILMNEGIEINLRGDYSSQVIVIRKI